MTIRQQILALYRDKYPDVMVCDPSDPEAMEDLRRRGIRMPGEPETNPTAPVLDVDGAVLSSMVVGTPEQIAAVAPAIEAALVEHFGL